MNKVFRKWFSIWVTRLAGVIGRGQGMVIDADEDKLAAMIGVTWCAGFVPWSFFFLTKAVYEPDCEDVNALMWRAFGMLGDRSMLLFMAAKPGEWGSEFVLVKAFGNDGSPTEFDATFNDTDFAACCCNRPPEGRRFWFVLAVKCEESPGTGSNRQCAWSCWVISNVTLRCFVDSWLMGLKASALDRKWLSCSSVI